MTGTKEEDHANAAEEEGGEKGGGDKGDGDGPGDGKKAKVPNLYRQLKGRLQKLIDKSDEEYVGRQMYCLSVTDCVTL